MLNIKQRQTILKKINLYDGKIDSIEGVKTRKAYKLLQEKYFTRKKDIDGIYGNDTDILLTNIYYLLNSRYFKIEEFRCHCNGLCTGYPHVINKNLITNLNKLREYYGKTYISSGLRCSGYNNIIGGATNSKHLFGKAADIINSNMNKTLSKKKDAVNKWLALDNSDMAYFDGYMKKKNNEIINYRSSSMKSAIHFQVK